MQPLHTPLCPPRGAGKAVVEGTWGEGGAESKFGTEDAGAQFLPAAYDRHPTHFPLSRALLVLRLVPVVIERRASTSIPFLKEHAGSRILGLQGLWQGAPSKAFEGQCKLHERLACTPSEPTSPPETLLSNRAPQATRNSSEGEGRD